MQLRRGEVTRGELLEVGVDERDYEALAAGLQRAAAGQASKRVGHMRM